MGVEGWEKHSFLNHTSQHQTLFSITTLDWHGADLLCSLDKYKVIYIYINIKIDLYIHIYIYIYMHRGRERERERQRCIHKRIIESTKINRYIDMFTHICVLAQ